MPANETDHLLAAIDHAVDALETLHQRLWEWQHGGRQQQIVHSPPPAPVDTQGNRCDAPHPPGTDAPLCGCVGVGGSE